jgi:PAS domain S-box-containing protein
MNKTDQKNILVVDDSPASLKLLTRILTDRGYRVRPATGGLLALRSVAARLPDLILLDVKMPDMDGFEVCRRLKSEQTTRDIPVLFISAMGETADKLRGFEAGGLDYITKPFEPEEVAARVAIHLKMREMAHNLLEAKGSLERRVEERTEELAAANRVLQTEILEHRRAEETLQIMKFSLDHAAVEAHLIDKDGRLLYVNDQMCRSLGYSRDELLSMSIPDIDPDFPFSIWKNSWVELKQRGSLRLETRHRRKDGSIFPVEITANYLEFSGREYNWAFAQDITERKRTEDALKLTQFSVDRASVSTFMIASDARLLYVNEQACRSLGYTREELLSMTVHDVDPNFPSSRWPAHWNELMKAGSLRFETQHRKKDGTVIPAEVSANYISFGGREYNWAFAQDIAERKRTENDLKRAYQLTKTIIDSMNDAISLIDVRDFTIVGVNSVFLSQYGYAEESELAGKHCYEVTHRRPDVCSPPDDICPLIETVRTKDHFAVDHVHYGKHGEKIYVEVSTSPIKDENGNVVQVVHVQRNITDRKLAEQERERLLSDLARSNKELEQFAYVASHDLQEPLRMVTSFLQLLERKYKGRLDEKADEYIHFAVDGVERMQKLIEALLSYSRISKRGAAFSPVDANTVFSHAVSNLAAAIQETGATVKKENLPAVSGDETQLVQLFQNLIANAIKYQKPGARPVVHISAKQEGDNWVFSVKDNGIGIEPQHFDTVFQIFQRLHSRTQYSGTGIGLAICKRIVERHHGRIWVESLPDRGATFFFTIPVHEIIEAAVQKNDEAA